MIYVLVLSTATHLRIPILQTQKQVPLTMAILALLKNEKLHQASKIMVVKRTPLLVTKKYIHFVDLINTT